MAGRGYKTETVVLRSLRFGEADRVLHLYTLERGRVGAGARPARPLLPTQAALAVGVPAPPDELRRVRGGRAARRLLAARGRSGLRELRRGLAAAVEGGHRRDRGTARDAARRCGHLEARRPR